MSLIHQYEACGWYRRLEPLISSVLISELSQFDESERSSATVYPAEECVFAALNLCPPETVRVVLLGQDPYHGHGQAHGLAFSVPEGVRPPPSLRNILKELKADTGLLSVASSDLSEWAKQGVLLLNTVLTVRNGEPGSHAGKGWEQFTDAVIRTVNSQESHIVFLLLGNHAAKKLDLIDASRHTIVQAPHPSPLSASRGFFGSKVFSRVNAALAAHNQPPIHW